MMNIEPINNFLLVKIDREEEKTKGGIIKPIDHAKKQQAAKDTGEVIKISPDAFPDNLFTNPPQVGDKVIFSKYAGIIAHGDLDNSNDDLYKLMPDTEIYAFIKKED